MALLSKSIRKLRRRFSRAGVHTAADLRLPRSAYREVWNGISRSEFDAKMSVGGFVDEGLFRSSGEATVQTLRDTVGLRSNDVVLEIGAGVGRVGLVLAPQCREWIGADVSANMLGHLRRRLAALPNVRAVQLSGYDLAPIPDASVDVVYSTVVFMHLEEWDRYAYVREGLRVLRPGGRMFVDNVDLTSDGGWAVFEQSLHYPPAARPPQITKASTPQELATYFRRAGFDAIAQKQEAFWIMTWGTKPAAGTSGVAVHAA